MFVNKNPKETVFNYCAQWSDVDDQEIDGSIVSMGAINKGFHEKEWLPQEGMHRGFV